MIDAVYPATPTSEIDVPPPGKATKDTKNRAQSFKTAVMDVVVTLQVFMKLKDAKFKQMAKKTFPARSGNSNNGEELRTTPTFLASVRATGPARSKQLIVDDM